MLQICQYEKGHNVIIHLTNKWMCMQLYSIQETKQANRHRFCVHHQEVFVSEYLSYNSSSNVIPFNALFVFLGSDLFRYMHISDCIFQCTCNGNQPVGEKQRCVNRPILVIISLVWYSLGFCLQECQSVCDSFALITCHISVIPLWGLGVILWSAAG